MTLKTVEQIKQEIAEAIGNRRLANYCRETLDLPTDQMDEAGRSLAQQALNSCQSIGDYCMEQKIDTINQLKKAGLKIADNDAPQKSWPMQIHSYSLEIDPNELDPAMEIFAQNGFLHWSPKTGGAWTAFKRFNHAIDLIKTDDVTTRLIVTWGQPKQKNLLARIFQPSTIDLKWIALPAAIWPLYYAVRPIRILSDRLKSRRWPVLGPYLGTPIGLIEPILEFSNVTENDVLFDLGCGDGRIMREAARLRGCRAVGIEQNEELIEIGRNRVASDGLKDSVTFVHGDASTASLKDATVVFLFLPTSILKDLLPKILSQLKPGGRVVAHEQRPIDIGIPPNRSEPIITPSAVTVAHIWEAGEINTTIH